MKSIFSTFYKPAQYWIDKIFIQNKKILYLSNWILRFQHRCHKKVIELHVVQFWSEIKLVISNQTCTVHLFEFEITKMMSDWIAPLSSMTIMNPTGVLIKDTNKKQFSKQWSNSFYTFPFLSFASNWQYLRISPKHRKII